MSKDFDAVELVRKLRDDLYEQTKDLSPGELVEYFRVHGAPARRRLAELRVGRAAVLPASDRPVPTADRQVR